MSLAPSPSPWACKTMASAGAGGCRSGHGRLPRWDQPGQQWGIPGAALRYVRAQSALREEVLVLQGGFGRGFCYAHPTAMALPPAWAVSPCAWHPLAGLGSTLRPICAGQRDRVSGALSLPFLVAVAEGSAGRPPRRCRADPAQPSPEPPLCACPASQCPWCLCRAVGVNTKQRNPCGV